MSDSLCHLPGKVLDKPDLDKISRPSDLPVYRIPKESKYSVVHMIGRIFQAVNY